MNIYKGLLFNQGYLLDPQYADDVKPKYAEGYGNRVANRHAFPKLGHAHQQMQPPASAASAKSCTAGACG